MKKEERTKNLLKNTAIFSISNLATRLITFFFVLLYTYFLNIKEYVKTFDEVLLLNLESSILFPSILY